MMRLFLVLLLAPAAFGCLHFAQDYKGHLKEGTKVAFLFHDGKNAHLVLKTDIQADEGKLPPEVAWVLPFPSLPSKYEEVDAGVFDELSGLMAVVQKSNARGMWGAKGIPASADAIKVHDVKTVGNYKIQPVEITGDGAAEPFNKWLEANHFNAMPFENQKQYLKKGAVFLAIRAKVDDTTMHFKPLHIVYKAEKLSFPLKFTHDTRTFDMQLYVFSPDRKGYRAGSLAKSYLNDDGNAYYPAAGKALPQLAKLLGKKSGTIQRFDGKGLNADGKSLKALESDPVLD